MEEKLKLVFSLCSLFVGRQKKIKTRIAADVLQIAEGGEIEVQILNIAQMIIRSTTLDFSTASPLLAMCCYALFFPLCL